MILETYVSKISCKYITSDVCGSNFHRYGPDFTTSERMYVSKHTYFIYGTYVPKIVSHYITSETIRTFMTNYYYYY